LSYARPVPKDGRLPRRADTLRAVGLRPVSRQTTMRKSAPFRAGAIVASPIRTITARRSLFPRSSTHNRCAAVYTAACRALRRDTAMGLPCSVR